jgi:hypothetical protein
MTEAEYFRLLYSCNLRDEMEEFRNKLQDEILYLIYNLVSRYPCYGKYLQLRGLCGNERDKVIDAVEASSISECYNIFCIALDSPLPMEVLLDYNRYYVKDLSALVNKLRHEKNLKVIQYLKDDIEASNILKQLNFSRHDYLSSMFIDIIEHYISLSIFDIHYDDVPIIIEELNNILDFINAYNDNPDDPDIFEFFMPP